MPKNNFSFEKRRKELAKKAKKEEKKNRKLEGGDTEASAEGTGTTEGTEPVEAEENPDAVKPEPGV